MINKLNNLKSLAILKTQRKEEEKAFEQLKNVHPHLSDLTDREILQFFGLKKREEIVGYKLLSQDKTTAVDKSKAICACTDAKGNTKFLYDTHADAKEQSLYVLQAQHIKLKVYACPATNGWHLSKS